MTRLAIAAALLLTTGVLAQAPPAAGLYARYVGGTGLQVNASGVVTQWWDEAGGGRALDRRGGSPRPIGVVARGTNRQVVRLDGSAWLWKASGTFGALTNDRTLVMCGRLASTNAGFLFDGSSNSGMTRGRVRDGSWQIGVQPAPIGNATNADLPTVAAASNAWQVHAFRYDHTGGVLVMDHFVDGAPGASVTQSAVSGLSGLILGANVQQQYPLAVDVAEVLVYDRKLADAELLAAQDYFTNAWGAMTTPPMQLTAAACSQPVTAAPPFGVQGLVRLDLSTFGGEAPLALTSVVCQLTRTTGVAFVQLFASADGVFAGAVSAGPPAAATAGPIALAADAVLREGVNFAWIGVGLGPGARAGQVLDATVDSFSLSDGTNRAPANPDPAGALTLGAGIARTVLRRQGQDGVNTYRIPGLAVSRTGTVLAVFDIRHASSADLPADIDVGLMRSTDLGLTWGPLQSIIDFDASVPGSSGNGVGDPSILVDRETGRIWVAGLWSYGAHGYLGSGAGLSTNETGQYVLSHSDDDGLTWSAPTNITAQAKADTNWGVCYQGPGCGIQLRDGTLVFPSQRTDSGGANARAFFLFSTNHGSSWSAGPPANPAGPPYLNENQLVELNDGRLLISSRVPTGGNGLRAWARYAYTNDLAAGTWSPLFFTNRDPVCQGSVCRYTSRRDGHAFDRLLFANPAGTTRTNMTVRLSEDEGDTWPAARIVEPGPSGYSCLATLPDGTVGLLFETGAASSIETLTFARFNLEWLIGDADSDGDGMPDAYEQRTGLSTNLPDADGDADGDGVSNLDEYRAGTRADEAGSAPGLQSAERGPDGAWTVAWSAVPWRTYALQQATSLVGGAWTDLPGLAGLPATAALLRCAIPLDPPPFLRSLTEP